METSNVTLVLAIGAISGAAFAAVGLLGVAVGITQSEPRSTAAAARSTDVTRSRYERVSAVLVGGGTAATSIAIAAGPDAHRWGPVTALLGIGLAVELFMGTGRRLMRARAARQASAPVPRNLALRKPLWISASENLGLVSIADTLASIPAALGYPSAGGGVLTILGGLQLAILRVAGTYGVTNLTFEEEGLRIGTCIHLAGAAEIIRSIVPDTPRSRLRAGIIVGWTKGNVGKITMSPWTAGLGGAVLARALQEGRPAVTYN